MLYATNRFLGDGMTTQYEISFTGGYLDRTHVKAYVEGADLDQTPVTISPGNFLGPYTIGGLAPVPVGSTLVIYRDTPKAPIVDFVNGSRFTESNLDTATRQGAFIAVEGADAVSPEGLAGGIKRVTQTAVLSLQAKTAAEVAAAAAGLSRDQAVAGATASNEAASRAAASAASAVGASADAQASATAVDDAALVVSSYVTTAVTAADGAAVAFAQATALLGVGIGTSYVDPEGDLIMTYVPPVTSVYIDADGNLSMDY
jgi:hypothetical protein